jgi:hypothetical protein
MIAFASAGAKAFLFQNLVRKVVIQFGHYKAKERKHAEFLYGTLKQKQCDLPDAVSRHPRQ